MNGAELAAGVVLLTIGALVGIIPTYAIERRKERHTLTTRWDTPLYQSSREYVATVRQFVHLLRRLERAQDRSSHNDKVEEMHAKLRSVAQELRILGSHEVQEAAREVEHHAWWVRRLHETGMDELAPYYGDVPAEDRLRLAVRSFIIGARRQLGVKEPDDVTTDNPIDPRSGNR